MKRAPRNFLSLLVDVHARTSRADCASSHGQKRHAFAVQHLLGRKYHDLPRMVSASEHDTSSAPFTGVAWTLWRRHVEQRRARISPLARDISTLAVAEEADSCAVAFRRWASLPTLQAGSLLAAIVSVCLLLMPLNAGRHV